MATYFVSGTDTDVGKTLVTAGLLHRATQAGQRTIGLKPVAAGCERSAEGLRNDDARLLMHYASEQLSYDKVNPIALEPAVAPHIAANQAGLTLTLDQLILNCQDARCIPHDLCLIEGAGGWRVPINAEHTLADLAKSLDVPVILVVGMRLGCLNHALLSAEAILRDGLRLAGWVANYVVPDMPMAEQNLATLKTLMPSDCLGVVPYNVDVSPEFVAIHLNLPL